MGDAAVEHVGAAGAALDRVDAGLHLGDHAARHRAVGDHRVEFGHRGSCHDAVWIVDVDHQARNVGEVDDFLGLQRCRKGTGDGIGVDVVGLTLLVGPDGGHHRDHVFAEQPFDDVGPHFDDVAHETQICVAGGGPDKPTVLAGKAHCIGAVHIDCADDVATDLAHQDHARHVECLGIGYPKTVAELGFFAEPSEELADLGPTTVHDDGLEAHRPQKHDVFGERGGQQRINHGVAAELDNHHGATEPLDIGKRLDKGFSAAPGLEAPVGGVRVAHGYRPLC